jgi:hypothetical protein
MKPRSAAIAATMFLYMLMVLAALAQAAFAPFAAKAQGVDEEAAIRAAALDYIEGWYTGDAARMERAVHPELAKRMVFTDPQSGASMLDQIGAMSLVQDTRAAYGARTPEEIRHTDVTVLDVYENAASVRIDASRWVDYLHLAKWNGEWKIVNVLWELHPQE